MLISEDVFGFKQLERSRFLDSLKIISLKDFKVKIDTLSKLRSQRSNPYLQHIRVIRHVDTEQFICKSSSLFHHVTCIVDQCTLQIYIKKL